MSETSPQLPQIVNASTDIKPMFCRICDRNHTPVVQTPKEEAMNLLADFNAASGMIVDDDGEVSKMSMEKFAHLLGWDRTTLYHWMDSPNWNEVILRRIPKVHNGKRMARVLRGAFVAAAGGNVKAIEFYARHFWPDYKDPKTVTEHDFTGVADLLKAAQERKIIDVSPSADDAATSGSDTSTLPA